MKTASTPPLSELEASFDRIDRQRGSLSEWIELARAVVRAQVDAQTSLIAQQGFLIKDQLSQGRMQALLAEIDARTRTVERLYTLYRAIGRKITGS